MATPVIMPRQGQSVESCIFTEWYVKVGDSVKKGDILFSYETDKASFEGEAPEDGILLGVFADDGDEVPVLQNIAVIGKQGESIDSYVPEGTDEKVEEKPVQEESEKEEQGKSPVPAEAQPVAASGELKISPRARKTAERLKVNYAGIPGTGPEGRILEKDIFAWSEKAPKATPLAKSISFSDHIDMPVKGSGPNGKVLSEDLKGGVVPAEGYEDIKLSNIRKIIAGNMFASIQNTAQLTLHSSANARKLQSGRKAVKKMMEEGSTDNITINDMVCFAIVKALKEHPDINAHFLDDRIRQFSHVNLGFAVDAPRGLMVPTLFNADALTLSELSGKTKELASQISEGNIDPDLLQGATFTVTNLGALGIEMFTPVLNPPQVAILGVNKIMLQPEDMGDGVVAFIPRIGLSLTFDHRGVDGAPAARFLQEVVTQIENIEI